MSINIKEYTKEQMAKMVEEARAEARESAILEDRMRAEIAELKRKITVQADMLEQMTGEAINKANEIANLKADADVLRNKLADTEAALGRANADAAQQTSFAEYHKREYDAMVERYKIAAFEAYYAKNHPWRNLWAWIKRKLGCKA